MIKNKILFLIMALQYASHSFGMENKTTILNIETLTEYGTFMEELSKRISRLVNNPQKPLLFPNEATTARLSAVLKKDYDLFKALCETMATYENRYKQIPEGDLIRELIAPKHEKALIEAFSELNKKTNIKRSAILPKIPKTSTEYQEFKDFLITEATTKINKPNKNDYKEPLENKMPNKIFIELISTADSITIDVLTTTLNTMKQEGVKEKQAIDIVNNENSDTDMLYAALETLVDIGTKLIEKGDYTEEFFQEINQRMDSLNDIRTKNEDPVLQPIYTIVFTQKFIKAINEINPKLLDFSMVDINKYKNTLEAYILLKIVLSIIKEKMFDE
jgi:hypothetical protein